LIYETTNYLQNNADLTATINCKIIANYFFYYIYEFASCLFVTRILAYLLQIQFICVIFSVYVSKLLHGIIIDIQG